MLWEKVSQAFTPKHLISNKDFGSVSQDMGWVSKLPYLGMKLGHWRKFQKLHMYSLSTQRGFKLSLCFLYMAAVSEIRADFQNCHIWAWNLVPDNKSNGCTYTLILPQGGEIELPFALRAAVSEIETDLQNWHLFGHETWSLTIGPEVTHIFTFYHQGSKVSRTIGSGLRDPDHF